jgi:hypothetical protein
MKEKIMCTELWIVDVVAFAAANDVKTATVGR